MKNLLSKSSKLLLDLLEISFIGVSVIFLALFFVAQPLLVTGKSMEDTLMDKEHLIAEKITIKNNPLEKGTIVIHKHPDNKKVLVVKRVIATPGDVITISQNNVYLNDSLLDENYLKETTITKGYEAIPEDTKIEVPDNKYILMGDSRTNSTDSRHWGFIDRNDIVGKVYLVYYPFGNFRLVK